MKKNLLTVLILALLIVNIALSSVMLISVIGTNNSTAQLVNNIATVLNLELSTPGQEEGPPPIPMSDVDQFTITELTIMLRTEDGSTRYILFDLTLAMNMTHDDYKKHGESIAEREGLIRGAVTQAVSVFTEEESINDFEAVRRSILLAVQKLFDSDFIYDIAISGVRYG